MAPPTLAAMLNELRILEERPRDPEIRAEVAAMADSPVTMGELGHVVARILMLLDVPTDLANLTAAALMTELHSARTKKEAGGAVKI